MLKIFDPETVSFLKDMGIEEQSIKKTQHKDLKKAVLKRLKDIVEDIEKGRYKKAEKYLTFSPAGDGMGSDNQFIGFDDIIELDHRDGTDLGRILEELQRLKGESR